MEKNKKINNILIIIILVLFISGVIGRITNSLSQGTKASSIVPLFGLTFQTHLIIFSFLWPILISIVCIIVFPLIFVPVIMKLKNKAWRKYENGFLDLGKLTFDPRKFLKRAIYLILLTMGVNAVILSLGLFDPSVLLPGEIYADTDVKIRAYREYPLYYQDVFVGFASLIFPFMVGIWSIGWALEDAGLMHYKLPSEGEKFLYEIEPVHLKYNSLVKGYGGISAILYLITALIFYITINDPSTGALVIMNGAVQLVGLVLPAYLIHLILAEKIYKKKYRKGMEEVKMITKDDYVIK